MKQAQTSKNSIYSLSLENNEKLIFQSPANAQRVAKKIDGVLSLTNHRILFKDLIKLQWEYPLESLVTAKISNLLLFIPDGILLKFDTGYQESLLVHKREEWILQILSAKAAFETAPELHIEQAIRLEDYDRKLIRTQMMQHLGISDVKQVCFLMDIDFELISGDNKESKVRELLLYCERHNLISYFIEQLKELFPHVDWNKD